MQHFFKNQNSQKFTWAFLGGCTGLIINKLTKFRIPIVFHFHDNVQTQHKNLDFKQYKYTLDGQQYRLLHYLETFDKNTNTWIRVNDDLSTINVSNSNAVFIDDNTEAFENKSNNFMNKLRETNYDDFIMRLKRDPGLLKQIENQTEEICKIAINQDFNALQYVKDQTAELSEYAIDKDPRAFTHVKNKTKELIDYVEKANLKHTTA